MIASLRSPTAAEARAVLAVHESAHAVCGSRRVKLLSLNGSDDGAYTLFDDDFSEIARDVPAWLRAVWMSLLAGGIAARHVGRLHGFAAYGGDGFEGNAHVDSDYQKACELVRDFSFDAEGRSIDLALPSTVEVERIVIAHWPAISRVAVALLRAGELDGAGFQAALNSVQPSLTDWLQTQGRDCCYA